MTNIKLGIVWIKNVCKSYGQMIKLSSDGEKNNKNKIIVFPAKQILTLNSLFLCYTSMTQKRDREILPSGFQIASTSNLQNDLNKEKLK